MALLMRGDLKLLDHHCCMIGRGGVDLPSLNRSHNTIETISDMRIANAEDPALPFEGCPVVANKGGPQKRNRVPAYETSTQLPRGKATVHGARKQVESPPSPRPSRLKLFQRRSYSSVSTPSSACSFYAGPQPTGIDGCPLRSCLKSSSSYPFASTSSVMSGRESSVSGHRVSFSHVQLREYCRQVGDNPTVSSGCPLAIGWKYNKRGKIDIDSYEADLDKDPIPCQRRSSKEREKLLSEIGGASDSQIMQGKMHAHFDRRLRAETLDQIGGVTNFKTVGPRERLFIMKESAARKLDRAKKGISPTQEQQQLWDDAQEAARQSSQYNAQRS
mmetsp:Transcript_10991/g.20139  ORF Transcript_10991/g.20139 Transcript_10991/m.20139 type:complete len:331 (-) Transcript_10991:52-1044(-)